MSGKDRAWAVWARIYPWAEWLMLGSALEAARDQALAPLQGRRRVLLLGDGDGRFLARLMASPFSGEVVSQDFSEAMCRRSRRRLERALPSSLPRVRWAVADARERVVSGDFDGVVTQFWLDCFAPATVRALVESITMETTIDARWLFADFEDPGRLRRLSARRQRLLLGLLYGVFRRSTGIEARTLPPAEAILEAAGWRPRERWRAAGGVATASTWTRREACSALAKQRGCHRVGR